jgi:predicted SAM-dependent methyltransferase
MNMHPYQFFKSSVKKIIKKSIFLSGYKISKKSSNQRDYLYQNYSQNSLAQKYFINIGAGSFRHKNWTNLDYYTSYYSKVQLNNPNIVNYNLMSLSPLPFPNNSIELAYTSQTIEHVTDEAITNLFKEVFRVLKKGGGLRIVCPDASLIYQTLVDNDILYWDWRGKWFKNQGVEDLSQVTIWDYFVREVATPRCRFYKNQKLPLQPEEVREKYNLLNQFDFLNWVKHPLIFDSNQPGDHINWWDETKIFEFLKKAGFEEVYPSRLGQSRFAPMRDQNYFDNNFSMLSLYVEAIKH